MRKKNIVLPGVLAAVMALNACGGAAENTAKETGNTGTVQAEITEDAEAGIAQTDSGESSIPEDDMFTKRDYETDYDEESAVKITLQGDSAETTDAKAVTINGSTITIQDEGCYILSGTLTDGQIIVDAEKTDKVQIVLNGVSITAKSSAALYVRQADKVFVTTAEGTENTLANGGSYVAIDENDIDAAIYAKDDLTLNGKGKLTVTAAEGHGIVSKDDLVFTSGTYTITAEQHAIKGKDSVRIADGDFTIVSGEDGIHGSNNDDETLGYVYIAGGQFLISAGDDGIHADSSLTINGGYIDITESYEGLEGLSIDINGGEVHIVARDDGMNAALASSSESETGSAGGAGDMAPGMPGEAGNGMPEGGQPQEGETPPEMPDGMGGPQEGQMPQGGGMPQDGQMPPQGGPMQQSSEESYTAALLAAEDGSAAAEMMMGGGPRGGKGGMGGGSMEDVFAVQEGAYISISGGIVTISASGDGIDSNGHVYISGGEIYVSTSVNGADAALDYNGDATITGGIFVAAGSSGMAQNFGEASTQGAMLVSVSETIAEGSAVVLVDADGNELLRWTPDQSFNCVVISTPEIQTGESYTVQFGTTETAVTMDSLLYSNKTAGFGQGGGQGMGRGGQGGRGKFREEGSGEAAGTNA